MNEPIYLDYAAATPVDEGVLAAALPYLKEAFYNPSALYRSSKQVHQVIEQAKIETAGHLGARSSEIIFTAGGTEANNLAISGIMDQFSDANIVVSAIEHESVLAPAEQYDCRIAPVDDQGIIDLDKLTKIIDDKTVLISVMYANNEIGTIQPLSKIGAIIKKIRDDRRASGNELPLYFHSDACQAANYLDLHVSKKQLDLMTLNGGKIYGFKQTGALFVKAGTPLKPQILGGGQQQGMRSGTENVAGFAGFATALTKAQKTKHQETKRLSELQALAIKLLQQRIKGVIINGSLKQRLPNNLNFMIEGQDNERLVMALDEAGIMVATGSACSASNEDPSHVLRAIGLSDQQAQSSIRMSFGRGTTEYDVIQTIETLEKLV